jgi:ADP-ribose pyrophosphatase YjhB (NUDIX family)
MKNTDWLAIAQRIQSIAQAGIFYAQDKPFDLERYQELSDLSIKILQNLSDEPIEKITRLFASERDGYQTPKVDVRSVIFNDNGEILLVKENVDGKWSLPGGWGDVGYSPSEVAEKEAWEETGLKVKAQKLLGVFDKKNHPHPPQAWYVYKLFILCEIVGGTLAAHTQETSEVAFFTLENLPPLSEDRIVKNQIEMMFDYYKNPSKPVYFD